MLSPTPATYNTSALSMRRLVPPWQYVALSRCRSLEQLHLWCLDRNKLFRFTLPICCHTPLSVFVITMFCMLLNRSTSSALEQSSRIIRVPLADSGYCIICACSQRDMVNARIHRLVSVDVKDLRWKVGLRRGSCNITFLRFF